MDGSNVMVFPDNLSRSAIDPGLLALINNNGGFGNGNWIWILFLWAMMGNGGFGGGFGNNNGTGYLANQISNSEGRDLLLQAINGRADALGQLASITNNSVETVKSAIASIQAAVQVSGLQTINSQLLGDANLSRQLCECCCENRLAIANQTNALQTSLAAHDASVRLQLAQNEAADQLSVCQQTNQLSTQAERNTNSILNAIAGQNTLITKEFCDLKERELQNKIDTQGDIITQLRGQISNDKQTEIFNAAFSTLNDKINAIAAKQPNTVAVQYPNLIAANATPYVGGYGYGYNYFPQNNFWN